MVFSCLSKHWHPLARVQRSWCYDIAQAAVLKDVVGIFYVSEEARASLQLLYLSSLVGKQQLEILNKPEEQRCKIQ